MVDFSTVVRFLRATGLSDREIARRVGTTGPTIARIAKGCTPRHDMGELLKALFEERYVEHRHLMAEVDAMSRGAL